MRMTSRPAIWPASLVACRCASLKYAGTVMTALSTGCPRYSSAACFSFCRIIAEISGGEYSLPCALTRASPLLARTTWYGTIFISSLTSSNLRPMKRLIEKTVFSGIGHRLPLGHLADQAFAGLGERDHRRRQPSAFGIGDDDRFAAFHDGDDRVGGAQVDADDFAAHACPRRKLISVQL